MNRKLTAQQIIDRALEILDERGWVQGNWRGVGGVCAEGAVDAACDEIVGRRIYWRQRERPPFFHKKVSRLRQAALAGIETVVVAEGLVRFAWEHSHGVIPDWNDHWDTTLDDVKRVLAQAKDRVLA